MSLWAGSALNEAFGASLKVFAQNGCFARFEGGVGLGLG